MYFQWTKPKTRVQNEKQVGKQISWKCELFNINSACYIPLLRLKIDDFLRGRAAFGCPLSHMWLSVPSAEPGQLCWDHRDSMIREVTKSVITTIIIVPAPHFPSLLRLLVCTEGLVSKGVAVCAWGALPEQLLGGRKDRALSPGTRAQSCPSSTRRHQGWKLPAVHLQEYLTLGTSLRRTSTFCSTTIWEGSWHSRSSTTSNCELFCSQGVSQAPFSCSNQLAGGFSRSLGQLHLAGSSTGSWAATCQSTSSLCCLGFSCW